MEIGKTLGARLRAARNDAGLSIRELARLAGINHSYLVKLETDQHDNPSAEKLQRLAGVLEIDAGELLAYVGVEADKLLPDAPMYFRRKYGMSEDDAAELARLVEKYAHNNKDGGEDDERN